jgi:hypothetical protein
VTIRLLTSAALALLLCNAAAATAQPELFVESGIFQSRDEFATDGSPAAGVAIGGGAVLSHLISVQFEWQSARDSGWQNAPGGPERFFSTGGSTYESLDRSAGHSTTYSALVAVHSREYWRVALAVVGGATRADGHSTRSGIREQRTPANVVTERRAFEDRSCRRSLVPTAGFDVTVAITERLSVVPELRLHLARFPLGTIVRHGVVGRWRF